MSDIFSKAKRSEVMSRIRGHGNKETEMVLAGILRAHRISGWRRKKRVFGKPDFVFRKRRLTIFVDGCFWHCCPKHGTKPASNKPFWRKKFAANVARDKLVNRELRRRGWRVLRIWEHEIKRPAVIVRKVEKRLKAE